MSMNDLANHVDEGLALYGVVAQLVRWVLWLIRGSGRHRRPRR